MATTLGHSMSLHAVRATSAAGFSFNASRKFRKHSLSRDASVRRQTRLAGRTLLVRASQDTSSSSSAPSGNGGARGGELLEPEHETQLADVARLLSVSTSPSALDGAGSGPGVRLGDAAAEELVRQLDHAGRAALLTALFPGSAAKHDAAEEFEAADANHDGVLDAHEFATYVEAQHAKMEAADRPLNAHQLGLLATRSAIGNIGFGVTDNTIMIIAGDIIEGTLGAAFGISTLMAAGLGNAVSDIIGTIFREYIEGATGRFLPDVNFSSKQLADSRARWAETGGATVGVTIGCLMGLAPLLVLPQRKCHSGGDAGDVGDAAAVAGVPVAVVAQAECGEQITAADAAAGDASAAAASEASTAAAAGAGMGASSTGYTRGITAHASISAAQWMGPSPIFRPLPIGGAVGERGGLGVALVLALSAFNVARRVRGVFYRRKEGGEDAKREK